MTNEEIAALRALAVAVPEYWGGVWYAPPGRPEEMWHTVYERNGDRVIADATDAPTAAYIAAANPAAVLSLLDERDALRKVLIALLADTQHIKHNCDDPDCPVDLARATLEPRA